MANRAKATRTHVDLDEIAPNSFIIHNERVRPLLKGEGVTQGHTFELVSERRAGLLARVRQRGFNVRTLYSRLKRLPALPTPLLLGSVAEREVSAKERWSIFDIDHLRWKDVVTLERGNQRVLQLPQNQIVRRRRSRSGGDFFRVEAVKQQALNLLALTEEQAVLHGYAQATADSDIEVEAKAHPDGAYELLINYVFPAAYYELLKRAGSQTPHGLLFQPDSWNLALHALHRLNLRPEAGDQELPSPDIDPTYFGEDEDD